MLLLRPIILMPISSIAYKIMKPSLSSNFTVSVRHQIWEESPKFAEFYRGIYSVTLNFLVNVMFVPEVEINMNNWPPTLPENVDNVACEFEARLFTLAISDYTVTPNSLLSGQQEILIAPDAEEVKNSDSASNAKVIFYVSPEEFEIFIKELSALSEQTPSVRDYVRISEIENLEFAKYLLYFVIKSSYLLAKDKNILAIENEVKEAVAQIEN